MNRRLFLKSTAPITAAALTLSPIALLAAEKTEYRFNLSVKHPSDRQWNHFYYGKSTENALIDALHGIDGIYDRWREEFGKDLSFSISFYAGNSFHAGGRESDTLDKGRKLFIKLNSKFALKKICVTLACSSANGNYNEWWDKYL